MRQKSSNPHLKEKLLSAVEAYLDANNSDRRELAKASNIGYSTLSSILTSDSLDHSSSGPGIHTMARLCCELRVPLSDFTRQANAPQSVRAVDPLEKPLGIKVNQEEIAGLPWLSTSVAARLFVKGGGRREAFSSIIEYSDEYEPPRADDKSLKVVRMGRKSLAAMTLGTHSIRALQNALTNIEDLELKKRWLSEYRQAIQAGQFHFVDALNHTLPKTGKKVRLDFFKALYTVSDAQGRKTILNFSRPLSAPPATA